MPSTPAGAKVSGKIAADVLLVVRVSAGHTRRYESMVAITAARGPQKCLVHLDAAAHLNGPDDQQ